jgi:glycosyl hydrolase family 106( putative alpha-L-rhamnosidase)
MKRFCRTGLLAFALALLDAATAAEPSLATLEQEFRDPPMEARRLTGPLFWLHGDESKDRLQMYVGKVAEGGNGCFTTESRPHKDWLQEPWFRDLNFCLESAKQHGLKMWIFDEKWWPSGEVGGKVPEQYGSKRITTIVTNLSGPGHFTDTGFDLQRFIGAVAGKVTADGIDGTSLMDLSSAIRKGTLNWEVPPGNWKVIKFGWAPHKSGGRYLVDGASKDSVDWYIKTVYQPHYDRFPYDFGKNIMGFFYDEPETHGDWGTEVMKVLAERRVDWKRALIAWKFKLAGEEQQAARYQYQDALAEAWGRTLYGGITRWCEQHHVKSIGHFLEHANSYLNQDLCAGNMFPLQKYSSMGAIDAVFDQFVWGKRVTRDAPIWQTPKLGSSITHAYGKPDDVSMVEIFGARGQDLTYPEMKWWTDHMQVSGVNFLIPHSFNPRSPRDTDCPPYFYNGGYEPRWPLYRVFADYTSRLSLMLTGGKHVCPVALLYLGGSAHVGKSVLPDQISEALQDALYDCDWLPYEVFENDMRITGRDVRLRNESYKILVVPAAEVVPLGTLAKANKFFDAGGVVVGYGLLPSKSATLGKSSQDIFSLREAIWGAAQPGLSVCKTNPAGGRSYFLPEKPTPEQLQRVLATDAGVHPTLEVLEGDTSHWLHVLHRIKAGRDVFFVANQNHLGEPRHFRFRLTAKGEPECWDPMRNEINSIPYQRNGNRVEISLAMQPNESVLLVFQPSKRSLPARLEPRTNPGHKIVSLTRDASSEPAHATPEIENSMADALKSCSWIWFPEGDPSKSAPPGERYFRKQINVAGSRKIKKATFFGSADNHFVLLINGAEAGHSDDSAEGWRNPVELDATRLVRPGANQLAISAVNASDKPNPAGVIGALRIDFENGESLVAPVDATWKASKEKQANWAATGFDDGSWSAAQVAAKFGEAPWGQIGAGQFTLSPVKANPFLGHCQLPADTDLKRARVYLEMDSISPETAARVNVNGHDAGGIIGAPLRLEVTRLLKPGQNAIRIEPFAPADARLVVLPKQAPRR